MKIRETVYDHTSGDETFTITANDQWSITMVRRLAQKYPDDVKILARNEDGSLLAEAPKSWMRIIPRRKVNLTEERRKELSDKMRELRNSE